VGALYHQTFTDVVVQAKDFYAQIVALFKGFFFLGCPRLTIVGSANRRTTVTVFHPVLNPLGV
jgi:hypothetical protein